MSALTAREQELYDVALGALPSWYSTEVNPQVVVGAFAKIFGKAWDQIDAWVDMIYLKHAFGIWLDAHARDRGTSRRTGENDITLAGRLEVPADAVTKPALEQIANAILAGAGVAGSVTIIENRVNADEGGAFYENGSSTTRTFWGHGWRWDGTATTIEVVVPKTTPQNVVDAVAEAMRIWAAGGVEILMEQPSATDPYERVSIKPPFATRAHGGPTVGFIVSSRLSATSYTWKVNGIVGGNATVGTVDTLGTYTPPAAVPFPEDVEVEVVGNIDPTQVGKARVKIT